MKGKVKRKQPSSNDKKPTRKQLRQQQRKEKKQRRHEYYTNRKKPGQVVSNMDNNKPSPNEVKTKMKNSIHKKDDKQSIFNQKPVNNINKSTNKTEKAPLVEELRSQELKEVTKLKKQMDKQRRKQLIAENIKEDSNIRRLEKQLHLHKRKSKSIPQSFAADGLDYLLEVCDPESKKTIIAAEEQLNDHKEFEEDLEFMTGKTKQHLKGNKLKNKNKQKSEPTEIISDGEDEFGNGSEEDEFRNESEENECSDENYSNMDEESEEDWEKVLTEEDDEADLENTGSILGSENSESQSDVDMESECESVKEQQDGNRLKRKRIDNDTTSSFKKRKVHDEPPQQDSGNENSSDEESNIGNSDNCEDTEEDGVWEDIYGRKRGKDGSVINENKQSKYVPPALRANLNTGDTERAKKLSILQKQLKGLLNRLAERNMHSIASDIENLYMNNSRNDMNNTITNLILESIVSNVITPERLLMEHVILIVILHANVGTEVGAHFLQVVVKKFDTFLKENHPVENKMLDNIVIALSYLYEFKLFGSKLIYEVVDALSEKFEEKEVECILHILKNVGFSLRKDDPLALKNLIMSLHKRAREVPEEMQDNSRVKFMLDILLAIKNNNVRKIPNYDPSYSEHLKKLLKGFIRKGNYVTQLNISLEDLLKADEKGKWWVVGSAWTGSLKEEKDSNKTKETEGFSQKILKQARKHRMNTDTRRNIFCIVMSAEDYLDAFQKLLRLGLKNQQEREIIDIILYCLLHEKTYNPYYTVLIRQFCDADRKYQMMLKYAIWDKLKVIGDLSGYRLSSLAKMLIHLFIKKALSISTLKVIEFGELDKVTMRFIRQIFLGILLHEDEDEIKIVFENIAKSDQLKMFREKINLFIHHFLLKNLGDDVIDSEQKLLLEKRAKFVEKLLLYKNNKFAF